MKGGGDLVSKLIMEITRFSIWFIGVRDLVTKSPDPPSRDYGLVQCLGLFSIKAFRSEAQCLGVIGLSD